MKKIAILPLISLGLCAFTLNVFAAQLNFPPLDTISFQLSAEKWASTQTAKVTVNINAALTDQQLGTIHSSILANLNKIVDSADWHITQFNRSKSDSGLEELLVIAQARVPESQLANLRDKAKSVSKPGETYTIAAIDFSPSLSEVEKVKAELRSEIYKEASQELERLNKEYPDEKFFLHTIQFTSDSIMPQPQPRAMVFVETKMTNASTMSVSDKVVLNANVILASSYHIK